MQKIPPALGTMWGPSLIIVRWLYEGIIKLTLTYSNMVWGRMSQSRYFLKQAHKLQRLALLPLALVQTQKPHSWSGNSSKSPAS